ncbi:diamine acetyltransferase 2-like isoform X2 [Branchiostoma floridae]|uniref:Diamine acetyltransferase 2-like isoform X2 n=1 Tax=Branchiostoma floridae TaxID=7739 RepID=A0A9J7M4P1_BRAFL|nr:diamine acetyltransferase 2-like isoform X2 [Branchiostoma floridae]
MRCQLAKLFTLHFSTLVVTPTCSITRCKLEAAMSDFRIRDLQPEDCRELVNMIKELAEFEGLPEQVKITEENGPWLTVGYAMYFYSYGTWVGRMIYLEDLYIKPQYRGKGIGTSMMTKVAQIGVENECQRMQWVVLNWNQGAIDFYKKHDSIDLTSDEKWHLFRMEREELRKFATLHDQTVVKGC